MIEPAIGCCGLPAAADAFSVLVRGRPVSVWTAGGHPQRVPGLFNFLAVRTAESTDLFVAICPADDKSPFHGFAIVAPGHGWPLPVKDSASISDCEYGHKVCHSETPAAPQQSLKT
jgi:hypothetical protein